MRVSTAHNGSLMVRDRSGNTLACVDPAGGGRIQWLARGVSPAAIGSAVRDWVDRPGQKRQGVS